VLYLAEVWEQWGRPRRAVAVVAHPDDESFGLGGVLAALVDVGVEVSVVCLTHGEASTLGASDDLGLRRDGELRAAASVLGVATVVQFDYPDGGLVEVDSAALDAVVAPHVENADLVVVFEPNGVTGHPDHRVATAVGERAAERFGSPVVEWGVAPAVAAALRAELGAPFAALDDGDGAVTEVLVNRGRQRAAIACHPSQARANAVLERRLALQAGRERVRFVPASPPAA
jgi:LmbE family N-acetylglucosaminyl deacetylase